MFRAPAALVLLASLGVARPGHAEPSLSDRFFNGTTPGEPSTAKLLVVGGFYTLSLSSIGVGVASLLQADSQRQRAESFKLSKPRGFCSDLAAPDCVTYHGLVSDARSTRTVSFALFGLAGLLAVGGGVTAELWHNDVSLAPAVALDASGRDLTLGLRGTF